uniref:Hydroxymethylglutaryl-CoA synthase n=1 Tax=Pistacia terebinthus subsp. palaestina TaxID=434239 RepID=A0A8F2XWD8_9ROSI|nr:hydroxymethylglutaryl-CoA synthase [Pistacia terebinthus subsp. palaestina]
MATPPNTPGSSKSPGTSEPSSLSDLQLSNKISLTPYGSIKLDRTNHLLWETLVLPVIRGHKSAGYIFGTKPCPPEYLPRTTPGSTVQIPNSDYEDWISNDKLLLGWLYSTMNPDIASQLMQKLTSKELWDAAKELSGAHTKSRVIFYKGELQKTRKGRMKMEEYLTTMKAFSDNLTLAGSPISLSDLITQILIGLDAEYTPIVVHLGDKESLSWIELQTTLLTFESRLEQLNTYQNGGINLSQATAHIAINRPENR